MDKLSRNQLEINFKKIKKDINYIDINTNTNYNIIDFNKDSNITYVFGVNGVGKSTICNALDNECCNKDIELFSYENNVDISPESIIINKNIKEINSLKQETQNDYFSTMTKIINDLKNLKIFSTVKIIKKFIIDDDIYFNYLCFDKRTIKVNDDLDSFINYYITNESELNIYKEIILKNKDKNINHEILINDDIDSKNINTIKKLDDNINSIYNDARNIFEEYLSKVESNVNIKFIKDIINFLELNNWDINRCPVCNNSINLNEIILSFKNKFDELLKSIANNGYLNYLIIALDEMKKWKSNSFNQIINKLNDFWSFSEFDKFMGNLTKIKNDIKEFNKNFLDTIEYIKFLILEKYYIIENNKITSKLNFIDKIEKIKMLETQKIFFDKDSVNLIEKLISQTIGDDRLNISINNGDILIDNNHINDEIGLSTGEKNFVNFAFSLLAYAKDVKENKIILIDDPASSLDNNNKFNIIYLINYFANKFNNFKAIVFTHNIDVINTQFLCNLSSIQPKLYILKNTRNLFWNDEETGFIEIPINDIDFLSLRKIRKSIIDKIKNKKIDKDFCKLNALTFVALIPIMRAFLYINDDNIENITKIMHYQENILNFKNDKELIDIFKIFYKLEDTNAAQLILCEVLEFINNFNKNENFDISLGFPIFNPLSRLICESMHRVVNMFFIRIFIEKKLNKNISSNVDISNMRKLINKSELDDNAKNILKCKRLLFNHYMHMENVPNLILPALEISRTNELNEIKSILKIFNKESIWVNHN